MTYGDKKATSPIRISSEPRERSRAALVPFRQLRAESTPDNYSFIQRILENGIDERSLYAKRTPKPEIPTAECEATVEAILS